MLNFNCLWLTSLNILTWKGQHDNIVELTNIEKLGNQAQNPGKALEQSINEWYYCDLVFWDLFMHIGFLDASKLNPWLHSDDSYVSSYIEPSKLSMLSINICILYQFCLIQGLNKGFQEHRIFWYYNLPPWWNLHGRWLIYLCFKSHRQNKWQNWVGSDQFLLFNVPPTYWLFLFSLE